MFHALTALIYWHYEYLLPQRDSRVMAKIAPLQVRAGGTSGISSADTFLTLPASNQFPCSSNRGDECLTSVTFQAVPLAKVAKRAKAVFQ